MKAAALLFFFFCFGLSSMAQPGASGGHLIFRVVDAQGRSIKSGRSGYTCFPTWGPGEPDDFRNEHPEWYPFARAFSQTSDGYWRYESIPTPAGGVVPFDFTINIVHGRDTMRIRSLDDFSHGELRVDSIPFIPGRFTVPNAYVGLLNVSNAKGRITNRNWELFSRATLPPDSIVAERLQLTDYKTVEEKPDSRPTCARLATPFDAAANTSAVYLSNGSGKPSVLLLRNIGGQVLSYACEGSTLVLLLANDLVLKSDDDGANWRVYQVRTGAKVHVFGDEVEVFPFVIKQLRVQGGQVLASGYWEGRWMWSNALLAGTYQLHFNPGPASAAYKRSTANARADMLAAITASMQEREASFRRNIRQPLRAAPNQAFVRQHLLRQGHFMQNNSYISPAAEWEGTVDSVDYGAYFIYRERPIVTLQNGHFQYTGSHWVKNSSENSEVPAFNTNGTYTFTDSTITFQARAGRADWPGGSTADFYPSGTYYYYFRDFFNSGQPLITLVRWNPAINRDEGVTFRLRK
jgi:hypothetical protein